MLRRSCSLLAGAKTLQDEPNTLTVVVEDAGDPVKLSFFGGIDETLSEEVKSLLRDAAVAFRPETKAAAKLSSRLD